MLMCTFFPCAKYVDHHWEEFSAQMLEVIQLTYTEADLIIDAFNFIISKKSNYLSEFLHVCACHCDVS